MPLKGEEDIGDDGDDDALDDVYGGDLNLKWKAIDIVQDGANKTRRGRQFRASEDPATVFQPVQDTRTGPRVDMNGNVNAKYFFSLFWPDSLLEKLAQITSKIAALPRKPGCEGEAHSTCDSNRNEALPRHHHLPWYLQAFRHR